MNTQTLLSIVDCPHDKAQLITEPGKGYVLYCSQCDTRAYGAATAKNAVDEFETQVRKARQADKRRRAKEERDR